MDVLDKGVINSKLYVFQLSLLFFFFNFVCFLMVFGDDCPFFKLYTNLSLKLSFNLHSAQRQHSKTVNSTPKYIFGL